MLFSGMADDGEAVGNVEIARQPGVFVDAALVGKQERNRLAVHRRSKRDRVRSLGEGEQVNLRIEGRKVRYKLGPPVDAAGQLASGRRPQAGGR